jgi:hypothetical protein
MRHAKRGPEETAGSALVPVLVVLMTLFVMGYAFFLTAWSNQKSAQDELDEQRAFYLAEAGLHEAFEAVRDGRSGVVGSVAAPALLGGGVLWTVVTDIDAERKEIVSTALAGRGRKALAAVIHMAPDQPPLFVATLNSKETLTLNAGVTIDSFDSEIGTYASQMVNTGQGRPYAAANGDVRSNQDIIANANAVVFGDATPGPSYGVQLSTGSYIDGSIVPSPEPFDFAPISFPTFAPQGNYMVPTAGNATLAAGNYDFDAFSIAKDATLNVTGPATIVVDSFTGGKAGKLMIDATNGPVTFFVRGTYTHLSGFAADAVTGSEMALAFLVDAPQDVVFPSAAKIRGAYYVPNANITFSSTSECWGAFAANRIDMSNDMKFHFDETLMRHWSGNSGNAGDRLSVLAWSPTGVQPASLVRDRRDPLLVLGLDADDLLPPNEAWE